MRAATTPGPDAAHADQRAGPQRRLQHDRGLTVLRVGGELTLHAGEELRRGGLRCRQEAPQLVVDRDDARRGVEQFDGGDLEPRNVAPRHREGPPRPAIDGAQVAGLRGQELFARRIEGRIGAARRSGSPQGEGDAGPSRRERVLAHVHDIPKRTAPALLPPHPGPHLVGDQGDQAHTVAIEIGAQTIVVEADRYLPGADRALPEPDTRPVLGPGRDGNQRQRRAHREDAGAHRHRQAKTGCSKWSTRVPRPASATSLN